MKFFKTKKTKGFTLIELIAIMAILAIIVGIAVPKFSGQTKKAMQTKLINDARVIEDACHLYYLDNGDWPRLSDTPLTEEELTNILYILNFDNGHEPEEGANYYDINIEALSKYIKNIDSNPFNFVLQNPIGSVYMLDPKTNPRLPENKNKTPNPGNGESINYAPIAVISMNPSNNIDNLTFVEFDSASTDANGDSITTLEWQADDGVVTASAPNGTFTIGEHIVKLRVQDEHGLWSDWVEKRFTVKEVSRLGQILSSPDAGWKRIDEKNSNIIYTGTNWNTFSNGALHSGSSKYTDNIGDSFEFEFYGTKFRIIGANYSTHANEIKVIIDGVVDGSFSQYENGDARYKVVNYEKMDLPLGNHKVIIEGMTSEIWLIDAIDINSDGYIVTKSFEELFIGSIPSSLKTNSLSDPDEIIEVSIDRNNDGTTFSTSASSGIVQGVYNRFEENLRNNTGYIRTYAIFTKPNTDIADWAACFGTHFYPSQKGIRVGLYKDAMAIWGLTNPVIAYNNDGINIVLMETNLATEKTNIFINGVKYSNVDSWQPESWVHFTLSRMTIRPEKNKPVTFEYFEFGTVYAQNSLSGI